MAFTETLSNNEKLRFRIGIWVGVTIVSIMLMGLSVTGAWIASNNNIWYTGAIAGVEIVAYFALTGIVFASNNTRRVVGWAIFIAAVTVCIFNAERAIKQTFSLRGSPTVLEAEAKQLDEQATRQDTASESAQVRAVAEQERLRTDIAEMKLERTLMASSNYQGAQERLCVLNLYPCDRIDGVRGELTLQAMQVRGEAIAREIGIKENMLEDPADATVSAKANDLRVQAAQKRDDAKQIRDSVYWIIPTLLALELIRSFAVWAFLLDSTMTVTNSKVREMEADAEEDALEAELDVAKVEAEFDEVTQPEAEAESEPPEPEPEPEAATEPDEEPAFDVFEERDPKIQRARDGGIASDFAKKVGDPVKIPVDGDFGELNIQMGV